MLLQIAIDEPDDLRLVPELAEVADILEIGTRVIKKCGMEAVSRARAAAPRARLLADMKTADGGALETAMVAAAGADLTTVLAHSTPATLHAVVEVAATRGLHVLIDTLGDDKVWRRPPVLSLAGEAVLALHTPGDARTGVSDVTVGAAAARAAGFRLALAGGIGPAEVAAVGESGAEIVIVGSAITTAKDPLAAARAIRERLPAPGTGWLGPR